MKKTLLSLAAVASITFATGAAQASDFYAGGSLASGQSGSQSSPSFKVFGGYQLTPVTAVELGLAKSGGYGAGADAFKIQDVTGFVKYNIPMFYFWPESAFYVKGGLAVSKATGTGFSGGTKSSLAGGVGYERFITDDTRIRIEIERIQSPSGMSRPLTRVGVGASFFF